MKMFLAKFYITIKNTANNMFIFSFRIIVSLFVVILVVGGGGVKSPFMKQRLL